MSASQWTSSGCDSGWTHYLDQTSVSKNECHNFGVGGERERLENEEEDDLSMVSDASSGPRHCCNADHDEYSGELDKRSKNNKKKKKKKKVKRREHCRDQHQSSVNDAASSSVLGSPKDAKVSTGHVLDSSQGFSATNFGETSTFNNQFRLFPLFKKSGGLGGRKEQ